MLRILVRGDFQNKETFGDTWDTTSSMKTLKYFLADYYEHKLTLHYLYFIGVFLQAHVKHTVFEFG